MRTISEAAAEGDVEEVRRLLEAGANVNEQGPWAPVHLAAQYGHKNTVKILVDAGADLAAWSLWGWNPLHIAAKNGHVGVAQFLLDNGMDKDARTPHRETPLHLAAEFGRLEVVAFLVGARASLEATNKKGETPLHVAAASGSLDVVKFLMDKGANKDAVAFAGKRPLHLAAEKGKQEIVLFLARAGADVEATAAEESTPLHFAALEGHEDVVKVLVETLGANKEAAAVDRQTPLHLAAGKGHTPVVEYLIKAGAKRDARTAEEGMTPVHLAAKFGRKDVLAYLFSIDAEHEPKTAEEWTPLHLAAESGHRDAVEFLLREGASLEARTGRGRADDFWLTPLHLATSNGHKDVVELLVQQRANKVAKTGKGMTPLQLACGTWQNEVAVILMTHIAGSEDDTVLNDQGHLESLRKLKARMNTGAVGAFARAMDRIRDNDSGEFFHEVCAAELLDESQAADVVQQFLSRHPERARDIAERKDKGERTVWERSVKKVRDVFNEFLLFYKRYRLKDNGKPIHRSAMCKVVAATDEVDGKEVALKFVHNKHSFLRELDGYKRVGKTDAVLGIIRSHDGDQDEEFAKAAEEHEQRFGRYCVVMPLGGRNLLDTMNNERLSASEVRAVLEQVANCIRQFHENELVHMNIKPKNILRGKHDSKFHLIDLDASAVVHDACGSKVSTAYVAPELLFQEDDEDGLPSAAVRTPPHAYKDHPQADELNAQRKRLFKKLGGTKAGLSREAFVNALDGNTKASKRALETLFSGYDVNRNHVIGFNEFTWLAADSAVEFEEQKKYGEKWKAAAVPGAHKGEPSLKDLNDALGQREVLCYIGKMLESAHADGDASDVSDIQDSYVPANATPQMDIFAFGVVAYYLICNEPLFKSDHNDNISGRHLRRLSDWNQHKVEHSVAKAHNEAERRLLRSLLRADPKDRPESMEQVLALEYFAGNEGSGREESDGGGQLASLRKEFMGKLNVMHQEAREVALEIQRQMHHMRKSVQCTVQLVKGLVKGECECPRLVALLPEPKPNSDLKKFLNAAKPQNWVSTTMRLHFICPVSMTLAKTGKEGKGYPIVVPKDWVRKYGPALQLGAAVLKAAVGVGRLFGLPLPDVSKLVPDQIKQQAELVSNMAKGIGHELKGVSEELKKNKLFDIDEYMSVNLDRNTLGDLDPESLGSSLGEIKALAEQCDPGLAFTGLYKATNKAGRTEWVKREFVRLFEEEGDDALGSVPDASAPDSQSVGNNEAGAGGQVGQPQSQSVGAPQGPSLATQFAAAVAAEIATAVAVKMGAPVASPSAEEIAAAVAAKVAPPSAEDIATAVAAKMGVHVAPLRR